MAVPGPADRGDAALPAADRRRQSSIPTRWSSWTTLENVKLVAVTHVVQLAGHAQRHPRRCRAGRTNGARWSWSTAHRPRLTGRSTCQALGCDFYAISGHKMCGPGVGRAVGSRGAARADGPVPDRRRDDPHGHARAHHLERTAVEVRGRHAGDRRVHRPSARPSTTCSGIGLEAIAAHERALTELRPRAAGADRGRHPVRARPPDRRGGVLTLQRGRHPPARRRPDPRRRRRSACAPAITAPSR